MGLSPPELDCLFFLPPVPSSQYRNPTIRFLLTALSRHIFLKTHTQLYIHTHLLTNLPLRLQAGDGQGIKTLAVFLI